MGLPLLPAHGPGDGSGGDGPGDAGRLDVDRLAFDLRRELRGEVRFDPGSRHLYAADASNFRQVPLGVVTPRDVDDLVAAIEICRRHGAPVTHRGGGTSIAGQAVNVAVVVDGSRHLRRIRAIDPEARTAQVEPGVVLDDLERALAPYGLTFGPDPATRNRCTIGGMIGNNACGVHAQTYGRTDENVVALDVLRYRGHRLTVGRLDAGEVARIASRADDDGRLLRRLVDLRDRTGDLVRERFPELPRRVSGYNLDALTMDDGGMDLARALVGSEGTLVTILGATLRLRRAWPHRALVVFGHPDVAAAGDHAATLRADSDAVALEGLDDRIVGHVRDAGRTGASPPDALAALPEGRGWLLAEFAGDTPQEAAARARAAADRFGRDALGARVFDADAARAVWAVREEGVGASSRAGGVARWPGWEDAAVPPAVLGDYLRAFGGLLDDHGLDASVYGHFGDGCVHARIGFDLESDSGVRAYRRFLEDAADLVVRFGGSLSGEHGDGQQRGELLERMFGADVVRAFEEFAAVWDPDGRMNPGKVVRPRRLDEDLRLAHADRRWRPEGRFGYPDDDGAFHRAQLRCVGIGKCRRDDGAGTMCPSWMVTHEERHSTRGRARLLLELLQPDSQLDGWRDEHVREALDLCLSCKGCTAECPVGVDIPTYKAEFLHHHYRGRLHPRVHYALGLIRWWARAAQLAPGVINAALAAPVLGGALKRLAGVSTRRAAPRFAQRTLRSWFADRPRPSRSDGPPIVLFPDTFTDLFEPQIGRAAVTALEAAGATVRLPSAAVCCGRPLYDHGFLGLAERALDRLLDVLTPEVERGARIVGLEPSCLAVFRDELVAMKPDDPRARRLAEATRTLAEALVELDADIPTLGGRAVVHGHCHQKAALGMAADGHVYDALGLDWRELDAGCCGLAGSFGFEAGEKDEVADRAGRRKLAPEIAATDDDTWVLADGFSCRTQIAHLQRRRRALHLAEVLDLAAAGPQDDPTGPPERAAPRAPTGMGARDVGAALVGAALVGAAVVGALGAGSATHRLRRRRADTG